MHYHNIIILDFGSQFTKLIARRIREINVLSYIVNHDAKLDDIIQLKPNAIILSGGPKSVMQKNAPECNPDIIKYAQEHNLPILAICYGFQWLVKYLGGTVEQAQKREFGVTDIKLIDDTSRLWPESWTEYGLDKLTFSANTTEKYSMSSDKNILSQIKKITDHKVLMSHSDTITKLPENMKLIATTKNNVCAMAEITEQNIFGVQFHPEVTHTDQGIEFIKKFVQDIAKCQNSWNVNNMVKNKIDYIKENLKNTKDNIICAVSGGVDSTVAAVLAQKAVGDNLYCVFVNHGLLRKNEEIQVQNIYKELDIKLDVIDAQNIFLNKLENVSDSEQKRKIIGKTFIDIFEDYASKKQNVKYLLQGTLYPDVIESVSVTGEKSATIKSHHNVGGLPEKLNFSLIEPLKDLFKDEVRKLGEALNINHDFLYRHPFPGPGLAIRIIGDINKEKINILQDVDHIFINALKKYNLYDKIWQAFTVLMPIKTVGVMGDERTYQHVVALRTVTSCDAMTAQVAHLSNEFLDYVSAEIVNQVQNVNRVVFDITPKPPASIEWE